MICVLPNPTVHDTARPAVKNGKALRPQDQQQSDQPLLDWIAGEFTNRGEAIGPVERHEARRILEQAFAAITYQTQTETELTHASA